MRRNIFASSIFIASAIGGNTFAEHVCLYNPRFISFGAGIEASRMGDLSDTSAQFGGGVGSHLYIGKSAGVMVMANISGSYLMRDEFDDSNRAIGTQIYGVNDVLNAQSVPNSTSESPKEAKSAIYTPGKASGIKNANVALSIGLGKDTVFSKEDANYLQRKGEDCYCTHLGVGINLGAELDYVKNKNKFIPLDENSEYNKVKIAINKVDMHSLKAGIFIDLNYMSGKYLSSISSEMGASFYGKGTYKFDVSVVNVKDNTSYPVATPPNVNYDFAKDLVNTTMTIKTKDDIGAYIGVRLATVYKVSDCMYAGIGLKGSYNYRTTQTNEDAVYGDSTDIAGIFYNESESVHYYPVIKEDEFKDPLSNNVKGSLHFIAMYVGK